MIEVNNDFKLKSKKVRQQDVKVTVGNKRYKIKQLVYSFDGTLFKTIMKQVEITDKTANQLKDKDINFKYGLYINDAFQYVDLGNFYIKDMEDDKKKEEMTVTGYDRMIRFMKTFKQSDLQLAYPCKMLKLVQRICEVCGVELYSTDFYNADLDVEEDFFTTQELTYRDVLEKVTQATLTTAFIKENKLYFCKPSSVVSQQLDKSYISNLVVKEKFGPLNVLVLGRGSVEDNVESTDEESITQNGRYEIRFDENEFVQEQREIVIDNMFEQIKGLEYYSYEASDLGVMWLEPCDCIELGDRDGNLYKTYYLKANITLTTGISSDSEAEIPDEANTKYKVTSKAEKKTLKVERLAKKNEGLIQDLIQETTDNTEKIAEHEISINGISDKVSNIADLTRETKGTKTITLENCIAGNLLELNIKGNNTVFDYLTLSDDLTLSDALYLKGDSLIVVTDSKGNSKEYELGIADVLRQNGTVYDEYILKDGKAQIIRRINKDGSIKDNEEIEEFGDFSIGLFDGTNTIKIKNYTAEILAKFAIKSDYSEIFTSKVETKTIVEQTSEKFKVEVDKKLDEDEFSTKLEQDYESVQVAWNKISDFIKMMVFNNNASLCVVDGNNKVIASFDKTGEHFYKSGETTPFGEMGVQAVDNNQYIAFSVNGEYETAISNGMAWGIKTKSDGKFFPILYIKDFNMGAKNSDTGGGSLVLTACDIVLAGIGTGIVTGGVRIEGEPTGNGLYFYDQNDASIEYLSIYPKNSLGEMSVNILDLIKFYKNQSGSNSFLIGSQDGEHCLFSSDGHIYGKELGLGGNVYIESDGSVTGNIKFYSIPNYQGHPLVYGVDHNYSLQWRNSQLEFWVDSTNVGTLSDKRLKKEIQNIDKELIKAIEEVEMKQFKVANRNGLVSVGILAQDLINIFEKYNKNPFDYEIVFKTRYRTDDNTVYYAINYEQFLILKQKANDIKLQEQQEMIEKLQEKLKELEDRINGQD